MGRLPKLRVNFDSDVQYLLRFKHAVEEDKAYPQDYRDEVVGKIVDLQRVLMNAPARKEKGSGVVAEHVKTPKRRRA